MPRTFARLPAFMRGKVVGMAEAGMRGAVIANKVSRKMVSTLRLRPCASSLRVRPRTRSGRACSQEDLGDLVPSQHRSERAWYDWYSSIVARSASLQSSVANTFLSCGRTSRFVVADELKAAGLAWLRRRRKVWIPEEKREARMAYGKSMMERRARTLKSFAHTDGTTVYVARDDVEEGDQRRRRLGAHVWKMSSGNDGLFSDNVGPSLYAANQGRPVKIWGFFANGRLMYYILPADGKSTVHMNGPIFRAMMTRYANKWKNACFGS